MRTACWLIYSALVLVCAARHEPWFDEAQSWLLARDCSLFDLLAHQIRYEGTPALWQMVLMPFAKYGFPYSGISFISAAVAIAGVSILLWRAPFPLWIRLLVPFTYIVIFQYAVVARSYVLLLPILGAIAVLYPRRVTDRSVAYCLLIALLANVSVHAALMAAVLAAEWLWSAWQSGLLKRKRGLVAGIVSGFVLLYLGLFFEMRLPPDLVPPLVDPAKHAGLNRALMLIGQAFLGGIGSKAYTLASNAAGVVILLMFVIWFRGSRAAILLAGMVTPILLVAAYRQSALWHSGIVFVTWIFALWIYFLEKPEAASRNRPMKVLIGAILALQAVFGLASIRFDIDHTYSGSKALAEYLRQTGEDRDRLYTVGFKSFAVQPYFSRNLFSWQEDGRIPAFDAWTVRLSHRELDLDDLLRRRPDRVIIGSVQADLKSHGYCEERRFDGEIWWKNGSAEADSYVLMKPC
jgi:hypothetical protein